MKATDLMIGDWVMCHYYEGQNSPHRFGGGDFSKGGWGLCTPIPLTEEILKVNGFQWREPELNVFGADKVLFYEDKDWQFLIELEQDVIEIGRHFYEDSDHNVKTEYVFWARLCSGATTIDEMVIHNAHELQHIFRLCRMDELADNFKIS